MALSSAGNALLGANGFGLGSNLSQQVNDETEEEKKKRKLRMSVLQSPAGRALAGPASMLGL